MSYSHILGSLPASFGKLAALQYLALERNYISGDIIPLSTFLNLTYLDLEYNDFHGSLEPLRHLRQLKFLYVSDNHFRGILVLVIVSEPVFLCIYMSQRVCVCVCLCLPCFYVPVSVIRHV